MNGEHIFEETFSITILTPTYNRKNELRKLYDSLKKQSLKSFEWLIVDDGSTDDTEMEIRQWKSEGIVRLSYLKKENGGKHTALNLGISTIQTELTFIVDSDDWLPEKAIETVTTYHKRYKAYPEICGYSFLRFYSDGSVNEAFYPENEKIDTYVNARINGKIAGDKAEVFFTEILKKYPFPVFGEERFLPEDLVWVKMSGPYKMVHINECVYISDYLEGGLTKSGRKMKLKSPRGMMARSCVYLEDKNINLKTKIKMALLYDIYRNGIRQGALAKEELSNHILILLCRIPGIMLYKVWGKKYR